MLSAVTGPNLTVKGFMAAVMEKCQVVAHWILMVADGAGDPITHETAGISTLT